jgi:hypothetical protein
MTHKEAVEILKGNFINVQLFENESHADKFAEAFNMAIEALEKADKYRWHDLRKNPDDLPDMDGDHLCFIDNEPYSYCSVCEWDNPNWYNYNGTESNNAIAWREIEPFEEDK